MKTNFLSRFGGCGERGESRDGRDERSGPGERGERGEGRGRFGGAGPGRGDGGPRGERGRDGGAGSGRGERNGRGEGGRGGRPEWSRDDVRHAAFLDLRQALRERAQCTPEQAGRIAGILEQASAQIRAGVVASAPSTASDAPAAYAAAEPAARHQAQRVSLEARRRSLTVLASERLTPNMQRVVLTSPDLASFDSRSPDDHIKLFMADGSMRDYTPRAFDRERCTLTLDFALHEAGPATAWALDAKPGDALQIGGPRGSRVVPDDFDWYLLIGDETALPAIGRRVEELRPGVPVITVGVVASQAEAQVFQTGAQWRGHWLGRDAHPGLSDSEIVLRALQDIALPEGEGYVWIAAEAKVARALREHFVNERQHPSKWLKAAGYWVKGAAGKTEKFE